MKQLLYILLLSLIHQPLTAQIHRDSLQKQRKFNHLVEKADNLYEKGAFLDAKTIYEQAYSIQADQYVKDQIKATIVNEKLKDSHDQAQYDIQYEKIIAFADKQYALKNYQKAREYYRRASDIRPADAYPKDKLNEIDHILRK
jgi:tetratricopeptide (TPR) repeat protein